MDHELLSVEEEVFKVMANQKRLEIILLLDKRELNVSQMIAMLGLRQANLSQHLALLKHQDLVSVRKKGRESYYRLTDDSIAQSIRLIRDLLRKQQRIDTIIDEDALFPIVTDPICGMRFSAPKAVDYIATEEGNAFYFCASGCKQTFLSISDVTAATTQQNKSKVV